MSNATRESLEREDPYRKVAYWYASLFEPLNKKLRIVGLGMLAPRTGMKILDVGCGTGALLKWCQQKGCKAFGIDSSPAMLEVARKSLGEGGHLSLGDAAHMPYEDESFDAAVAMLTLHEMRQETRQAVLHEMKRVLRTDGTILLIDFHSGRIQPFAGWWTKLVIIVSEVAAGREHFRNYRDFMKRKGLPALVKQQNLETCRQRVVGGGTLGIFLLKKQ